jgi:N-acetyl-gamma-glutamyl-phosphate reductase
MIEQYQAGGNAALDSPRPYALGLAHKHIPEVMAHGRLKTRPLFMPIVANFYKGLGATIPLHLGQSGSRTSAKTVHAAYMKRYADEPFVRVLPLNDATLLDNGFYDVQACNDTNHVDIHVLANGAQAIVMARLDNLGKGASGAAVQCMNLHLGVEEGLGL